MTNTFEHKSKKPYLTKACTVHQELQFRFGNSNIRDPTIKWVDNALLGQVFFEYNKKHFSMGTPTTWSLFYQRNVSTIDSLWEISKHSLLFPILKKKNECIFKNVHSCTFIEYDGDIICANFHLLIRVHASKVQLMLVHHKKLLEYWKMAPYIMNQVPPKCTFSTYINS